MRPAGVGLGLDFQVVGNFTEDVPVVDQLRFGASGDGGVDQLGLGWSLSRPALGVGVGVDDHDGGVMVDVAALAPYLGHLSLGGDDDDGLARIDDAGAAPVFELFRLRGDHGNGFGVEVVYVVVNLVDLVCKELALDRFVVDWYVLSLTVDSPAGRFGGVDVVAGYRCGAVFQVGGDIPVNVFVPDVVRVALPVDLGIIVGCGERDRLGVAVDGFPVRRDQYGVVGLPYLSQSFHGVSGMVQVVDQPVDVVVIPFGQQRFRVAEQVRPLVPLVLALFQMAVLVVLPECTGPFQDGVDGAGLGHGVKTGSLAQFHVSECGIAYAGDDVGEVVNVGGFLLWVSRGQAMKGCLGGFADRGVVE